MEKILHLNRFKKVNAPSKLVRRKLTTADDKFLGKVMFIFLFFLIFFLKMRERKEDRMSTPVHFPPMYIEAG